jgi:hypothetical protein
MRHIEVRLTVSTLAITAENDTYRYRMMPTRANVEKMMERAAAKLDYPLYAIDDETAIKVADGRAEVVSEGE